jgi:hypothetical protein
MIFRIDSTKILLAKLQLKPLSHPLFLTGRIPLILFIKPLLITLKHPDRSISAQPRSGTISPRTEVEQK